MKIKGQSFVQDDIQDLMKKTVLTLKQCCDLYPTCEGCQFNLKHFGCYFRGKSPKDYKIDN